MSILELFCSVDDFWQQFAPHWQQELLASGQRERLRLTQMHRSRDHDHSHLVPPVALSYLQGVLHRVRPSPLAQRFSNLGELSALCRVDAYHLSAPGGLSA